MFNLDRLLIFGAVALQAEAPQQAPSRAESYFHYIAGSLASLERDSQRALEHFRFASHLDSSSTSILLRQAQELADLGQIENAKDILQKISSAHQEDSDFHLLASRLASQELDVDAAVQSLDKAIALFRVEQNDLKARESILTKVALLADFKKYDDCVVTLQDYLKVQPDDEVAHYFLGKIHSVFQKREEAKKSFERALELRPSFSVAARALGLQLELEGNLKDALRVYQTSIEAGGGDEEAYQKVINLSLILEDYSNALVYLQQYLILRPDDAQSQLRAGLIHLKLRELDEAKKIFEKLLQQPDVAADRVQYYLGAVYEEVSDYERAAESYLKVAPTSDYYSEARLQGAVLLNGRLKKPQLALNALEEGVRLKADDADLVLALANQYDQLLQIPKGLELLQSANSRFKDHERLLFLQAVLLDKSGFSDQAIVLMRKVLAINPNNHHALNHIGYTFAERNFNLPEAEQLLKRAAQLAPDNGFVLDSLGWLYHRLGSYKKSLEFLEKANRLSPGQVVILEHLADTYKKLGRDQDALAIYRQIMGWSSHVPPATTSALEDIPTNANAETRTIQERVRTKIASLSSDDAN